MYKYVKISRDMAVVVGYKLCVKNIVISNELLAFMRLWLKICSHFFWKLS